MFSGVNLPYPRRSFGAFDASVETGGVRFEEFMLQLMVKNTRYSRQILERSEMCGEVLCFFRVSAVEEFMFCICFYVFKAGFYI